MNRLAIVSTHPIQYNAPLFQLLAANDIVSIKVFYTWGESVLSNKFDPGFGKNIEWDIPLLQGYDYSFVKNISPAPGSHSYKGIDNPSLVSSIENWGASAVLVYGWNFKSHLYCLRYFHKKIPVLFRGDSTLTDKQPFLKNIARKFVLSRVYRNIDIALYTGTKNKEYFKAFGLKENQLVFAPHAVQNERFAKTDNAHDNFTRQTKKDLSIQENETVVVFSGKFQQKKDPQLLLKVFKHLNYKHSHLVFVGDGELTTALKAAAQGFTNIHFLPFQNQSLMPAVYRLGDIFCLPSKGPGETWGLAVNEAMASGRAIIASDKTGCAVDLVKDNINGFVFKAGDEEALREILTKMLSDKKKVLQMGDASKEIIKDWSLSKTANAIINIV
ncbi:MAG: glycosyltransferase family 4 protein [Bacteroidota bacterium]